LVLNVNINILFLKDLNQSQVSEQLESLSQSGHLGFSKISKDNQNILTAYLHSDDFYFEVPINLNGILIFSI
jgi:hypothetical protein